MTRVVYAAADPVPVLRPATIRGNENEDDACVLVSEMEKVTRVPAATAVYVCGASRRSFPYHRPTFTPRRTR